MTGGRYIPREACKHRRRNASPEERACRVEQDLTRYFTVWISIHCVIHCSFRIEGGRCSAQRVASRCDIDGRTHRAYRHVSRPARFSM